MVSSTTGTTSVTLRPLSGYTPQVSDKLCYTPSPTNSPCLSVTFGTFSRPFDFRNIRILYSSSSTVIIPESQDSLLLKDQYGPRTFFLEFPFFAKNMIIKSILNLWWHSKILKLFLGVVRGIFTKG